MHDARQGAPAVAVLLAVLTGCGGCVTGSPTASTPPSTPSPKPGASTTSFATREEPVVVEPGTYRIAASAWSVANFTLAIPEGWTVQYGHVFGKNPETLPEEFGFGDVKVAESAVYAVVVDEIYADACEGDAGEPMKVGASVDDLAAALLQQPGPMASGPVATRLGGYPASRIDLIVPEGLDLEACSLGGVGLQIWYSRPADKYFVLLADGTASVYILDVNGQRQVFLTQYRSSTSDEDLAELQGVLDSIQIET